MSGNLFLSSAIGSRKCSVQFNLSQVNDFVKARAIAVSSQIPGAIFRFASQTPTSLEEAFATPNGFLNLTKDIYVRHSDVSVYHKLTCL